MKRKLNPPPPPEDVGGIQVIGLVPGFSVAQAIRKLLVVIFFLAAIVGIGILLAGCGARQAPPTVVTIKEPVEVKVPVPIRRVPPPELLNHPPPALPVFVAPSHPEASSALTAEGERVLRALIEQILGWDEAWKAWAQAPE